MPIRYLPHTRFARANRKVIGDVVILYSQYTIYAGFTSAIPPTPVYNQLASTYIRKRIVGLEYHIDITLTGVGFSGVENTDWTNLYSAVGQDTSFRNGSRDTTFVVDCEITATGFAGVENTDWEELFNSKHPTSVQTTFRDGVRGGAYVIDQALTVTGFSGIENIDWVNLNEYKVI